MRTVVAVAVLVAGCHEPTEANWYEYSLIVGRTADQLASVEKQLGMLPDPNAMVMPLAVRIAEIEKRVGAAEAVLATRGKQVYLVAKPGTPDEKVIGLGAVESKCAISEELGGTICFDRIDGLSFSGTNCDGDALSGNRVIGRLLHAYDGRVFRVADAAREAAIASAFRPDGSCYRDPQWPITGQYFPLVMVASLPYEADDVRPLAR